MTACKKNTLKNRHISASKIENEFERLGKRIRGGGEAGSLWCCIKRMTRVLIETGFISNVEEGNRLDSEEGQNEIL
jgi:N-acetylmuramoyl-L-alanine amidase